MLNQTARLPLRDPSRLHEICAVEYGIEHYLDGKPLVLGGIGG